MYFDGGLPLHAAVRCGDVAALRRVVQSASEGEDTEDTINQKDKYGQTPLFIACMERNIQMVHSLLLLGADVNSPSGTFSYPLHVACDNQSNDVAVVLLDNGAAVNCQDRHEFTPLMLAVNRQDTKCIASLLSRGARTDIRNRYQLSALTMACRLGNILIVRQLILFGADVNEIGEHPPLLSACEYGDIDILHLLIGSGADVNVMIDGWSILFHYVESCRSPCKQTEDAITDVLNALWLGGLTITQELCDKISYLVESTLHPFYKLFVNWLKKKAIWQRRIVAVWMRGGCRALRVPAGTETPASTAESCDSFNPFCEDDSTEGNVMKITGNESNSINARERLPIGINSNILYCIPEDVSRYVISFI